MIGFVKNKLYAARRHTTQSRSENDRVKTAGASASATSRRSNGATRGLGYFEMKPANVEQHKTIVILVPQVTQMDAQQGDWILMLSESIAKSFDYDEIQQIVNTRLAKCHPNQDNTVVQDLIKASVHKGATGTCTAMLHVIGLDMSYNRSVGYVQTLDTLH